VQWIDIGLLAPTIAQAFSAGMNSLFFWRYARARVSRARRAASFTLALLCGALWLEALLFAAFGAGGQEQPLALAALVALRWLLLASTGLLSLLVLRSPLRRL